MQNRFSCLKQNKTPTVLGFFRLYKSKEKIEKSIYIQKSDIEEFEKSMVSMELSY